MVSGRDDIEDLTRELGDAVVRDLGMARLGWRDLFLVKGPEDEPVVEPEGWPPKDKFVGKVMTCSSAKAFMRASAKLGLLLPRPNLFTFSFPAPDRATVGCDNCATSAFSKGLPLRGARLMHSSSG